MFTILHANDAIEEVHPLDPTRTYFPQAQIDQVDLDIVLAGLGRTGMRSGLEVTAQGTPDDTVHVAAGEAVIADELISVAADDVAVSDAHATLRRFDLIVVDDVPTIQAVIGTPATMPVFPALPADMVALAALYRPAGSASFPVDEIKTAQITDKRVLVPAPPIVTGYTTVPKTADETVTASATLQDDDHLFFSIDNVNGKVYEIELVLRCTTSALGGYQIDFSVPSGASVIWTTAGDGGSPSASQWGRRSLQPQTSGTPEANIKVAGVGTIIDQILVARGWVIGGGTAGTIRLRWAQNAASGTSTLKKGSVLRYMEIAA